MAGPVIRPFFARMEKGLDLNSILGELLSNNLISENKMRELHASKNSTQLNREFLMHLWNQPLEQLKSFCHILQRDIGNAFHQGVAKDILVAISPDPWMRLSDLLQTIANQLTQSLDARAVFYQVLKQAMDEYQMNFPQQPLIFLLHLLLILERIATMTDVTAVRREIFQVCLSLDW